tara:strand:+ start:2619 stop:3203 length:585 start_codon:yes stop_codon:yes gene_type:complete
MLTPIKNITDTTDIQIVDGNLTKYIITKIKTKSITCTPVNNNQNTPISIVFTKRTDDTYVLKGKRQNNHKHKLYYPPQNIQLNKCAICNEEQANQTLPCNHQICTTCLLTISAKGEKKCPFCRTNYKITSQFLDPYVQALENERLFLNRQIQNLEDTLTIQSNYNNQLRDDVSQLSVAYHDLRTTFNSQIINNT